MRFSILNGEIRDGRATAGFGAVALFLMMDGVFGGMKTMGIVFDVRSFFYDETKAKALHSRT